MKLNAGKIEQERAEAKAKQAESNNDAPEGWGKPQENAAEFKSVGFTLKPKKRSHAEAFP